MYLSDFGYKINIKKRFVSFKGNTKETDSDKMKFHFTYEFFKFKILVLKKTWSGVG